MSIFLYKKMYNIVFAMNMTSIILFKNAAKANRKLMMPQLHHKICKSDLDDSEGLIITCIKKMGKN